MLGVGIGFWVLMFSDVIQHIREKQTNKKTEAVPLVEFMYLVFIRMSGESYRRRLRSSLYLWCIFRALMLYVDSTYIL